MDILGWIVAAGAGLTLFGAIALIASKDRAGWAFTLVMVGFGIVMLSAIAIIVHVLITQVPWLGVGLVAVIVVSGSAGYLSRPSIRCDADQNQP